MLIELYGHTRGPGTQHPAVHFYMGPFVSPGSGSGETQGQNHLNPGPFGKGVRCMKKGAPGAYVLGEEIPFAVPVGRGTAQDLDFGG